MSVCVMKDLLPSRWKQSEQVLKKISLYALTTTLTTAEYKFSSSLMSSPATIHQTIITHTHMHEHACTV